MERGHRDEKFHPIVRDLKLCRDDAQDPYLFELVETTNYSVNRCLIIINYFHLSLRKHPTVKQAKLVPTPGVGREKNVTATRRNFPSQRSTSHDLHHSYHSNKPHSSFNSKRRKLLRYKQR